MKDLKNIGVVELSLSTCIEIDGGFWGEMGYAVGYVGGAAVRLAEGLVDGLNDAVESGMESIDRIYH